MRLDREYISSLEVAESLVHENGACTIVRRGLIIVGEMSEVEIVDLASAKSKECLQVSCMHL